MTRTVCPTVPPRVHCALTELGRTLIDMLRDMGEWAVANRPAIISARAAYDARAEG